MPDGDHTSARCSRPLVKALGSWAAGMLALAMAACSGGQHYGRGSGSYASPGSPADPWGPYVREAAGRFGVPETWVREVMRQESGGKQSLGGGLTTSSAGAMGLMQIMPATYDGLRQRYGLGDDPYDPHDNIMAGTAYIREMYDRFGAPNFLAAYNAGPRRVDDYLASGDPLPSETVNYVASIGPRIGGAAAIGGTAYAAAGTSVLPQSVQVADAMAPIASPGDPGVPAPQLVARMEPIASPGDPGIPAPAVASRMAPIASPGDPGIPPVVEAVARAPLGTPLSAVLARLRAASALPSRSPPPGFLTLPPARLAAGPVSSGYGVQVGAYATSAEARTAAESARAHLGVESRIAVGTTRRSDGSVLFRARVFGLTEDGAAHACERLQASGRACFVVPPDGFTTAGAAGQRRPG